MLVSSGLHGVEGFFGSAVQVAVLEGELLKAPLPARSAIVLVHALNPYGFASLRRFDANNVDLNRNFLLAGERFEGCPPDYRSLNNLLNPKQQPRRFDLFPVRALLVILSRGLSRVKQTVAGGQYEFPQGLFFGGKAPSHTSEILRERLPTWVGGAREVLHVDFHTGLGRWADYKLLVVDSMEERRETIVEIFGPDRLDPRHTAEPSERKWYTAYLTHGDLVTWCQEEVFAGRDYIGVVGEFGTLGPIAVLTRLRAENQAHHWTDAENASRKRAKERLKLAFAPDSTTWRSSTVAGGVAIVGQMIEFLRRT
jgi:hypothetical protein